MTPERWRKIEEIFNLVVDAEPAAQAALLEKHCNSDAALRREIEALLGGTAADDFLRKPINEAAQSLPQTKETDFTGARLGTYQLTEQIGKGGMGVVYRALDTRLGRAVALKLLPAAFVNDDARLRRFRQEARAISALNHPNILTIHEIGEAETTNGTAHFIATEFVEGRNLRAVMKESTLTLGAALDVLTQVTAALSAAHEAGVIHRDLKPENLMLRPDGVVKVLDFGLAKFTVSQAAQTISTVHTDPGLVMGTVKYMSPEQARGLNVDARSDIFSLGVVAYELLAGRAPFAGATTSDVLVAILEREPPPLKQSAPALPAELSNLIHRALAKDATQRYQHVSELHGALKDLKQELELAARLKRSDDTPQPAASLDVGVGKSAAEQVASTDEKPIPVTTAITKPAFLRRFSLPLRLAAVVLFALALWASWALYRRTTANDGAAIQSIAVLPFVNVGNDPQMEYLSDGITESLMQSLQQTPGLRVMARGTVFSYKGREVDPRQVGETLQVQAVINGRVEKRDEQLLIWVELADARNGSRLWSDHYPRQMKDLIAVQAELTRAVSRQLTPQVGAQPVLAPTQPKQNAEAYRLYLLGNYHANKQSVDNELKALDYYQQALVLEPNYALAYTGIASIYAYLANRYLSPQEAMPKARAAALRALELNNSLAEAHHALALVKGWADWDWQGAETEFKRALELNPNLATTRALYANTLSFQRRFPEFHREIALARQLDPLSSLAIEINIWGLYFERRYDEVLTECQKLQSHDPNYSRVYVYLSLAYRHKGQLREAIAAAEKGLSIQQSDHLVSVLAYLYAVAGQPDKARQLLAGLEQTARQRMVSPFIFTRIHVGLGEYDRAFTRLQETFVQHSEFLFSLPVDPIYDPLRADSRYAELVRNIGLQP